MKLASSLLGSIVSAAIVAAAQATGLPEEGPKGQTPEAHSAPAAPEQDSDMVRRVEEKLKGEGYTIGEVDGRWDAETRAAVTQFQKAEGLNATGTLDQDTLRALGLDL
ncbi:MAG TPA: peptidoglycan-binding domain-containing protein [Burkholderiales bacterium]